jgi:endonuclease/exonuclease/phosphatase (EEP) superfamily protein YafD
LKIISWNLFHTHGAAVEQIQALVMQHCPDLILMQEATASIDTLPRHIGGFYTRVVLPGRLHGLASWSAKKFSSPTQVLKLQRGVIVRRVCQIVEAGGIAFANVHLSHGQVLNRLQLRQIAAALPPRAAILGDCNMVGRPLLRGFADVGPRQPTHRSANLVPLRLDRCFTRNVACKTANTLAAGPSDHHAIMVELA